MSGFLDEKNNLLERYHGMGQGTAFVKAYAGLVDDYLIGLYKQALGNSSNSEGLALVALGGYGRGEMAPHSDVDLLFLSSSPKLRSEHKNMVESVLYPLWDLKLQVGQAVRTPDECLDMAREDFATLSTQLDARYLAGDGALFADFIEKLYRWLGSKTRKKAFLKGLKESISKRHGKYGQSPYLLEPNVKEGHGALRDIHAIRWAASGLYDFSVIEELPDRGLLSTKQLMELKNASSFMTDVRVLLHKMGPAKNDALTFDMQEKVAQDLDFRDNGHISAVEMFMQRYYIHAYQTKSIMDYFLSRVREELVPSKVWKMTSRSRKIEKGLKILRGQIEIGPRAEIRQRPVLMMRAFEISVCSGLPISHRSLELIRTSLDLVDDDFRRDAEAAASFMNILTALPPASSKVMEEMDPMQTLPLLYEYIPEFSGVRARVQHDAYHVYTVDVHQIITMWEIKKIARGIGEQADIEFEQAVFNRVNDREILFLAALLHDIGKGRGKEHAKTGSEMMPEIAGRLGISKERSEMLSFLVAEHLFLAHTAMRRDLSEEKLIINCARKIGDQERLNMLYLITVADSRATGPTVLTQWKNSLLKDLYSKIYRVLTRSDLAGKEMAGRTDKLLIDVVKALEDRYTAEEIDTHLEKMSAHYLSVMNVNQVVRHILLERELQEKELPMLWEVVEIDEDHREVTILAPDRPGLLARLAGVFTLHHINILGAQVFTRANNIALDIFQVETPPDRVYENETWEKVKADTLNVLTGRLALDYRLAKKKPLLTAAKPVTRKPDDVIIDNETSDFYTIVEVYTYDRLGLLYAVTQTLYDLQLSINIAKISTNVEQVVDVFYVKDFFGQKLLDKDQIRELKEALLFTLEK